MVSLNSPLVTIEWLNEHLSNAGLIVLDASLGKHAKGDYQIPGTRSFDLDNTFSDKASALPHTLPSPDDFQNAARKLGIHRDSLLVIYDRAGVYSSPRARWMFQVMGHSRVVVLDGGFPAWIKRGLAVERKSCVSFSTGNFEVSFDSSRICNANEVAKALGDPNFAVLDARSEGRFKGEEPEPRPGLRLGHMPGAVNLPFEKVLSDGHFKPTPELSTLFAGTVRKDQKLIYSCGSGVTACILALAGELSGYLNFAIYDGSWSEWGMPSSRRVVKGQ